MNGKIKLKPIKNIWQGMIVIFNYSIQIIESINGEEIYLEGFDYEDYFQIGDLKTIVIEYEKLHSHAGISKKGTGPGVGKRIVSTEELPVKIDEWQYIMEKGLINLDVEFAPFWTPIKCETCNGTGKVQQTDVDYDDCRKCNGNGSVPSETYAKLIMKPKTFDVYDDMRRFGLTSDQCVDVSNYIEKNFTLKNSDHYDRNDLYKLLLDYIEFPHPHEEPRGITVKRFIAKLK